MSESTEILVTSKAFGGRQSQLPTSLGRLDAETYPNHENLTSLATEGRRFWEKQADRLTWETRRDTALDWSDPPFAKWFVGGKINAAYNCVDRHVEAGAGDKVAFHWVGEPAEDSRDITYAELKDEVCRAANAITELGIETGDRVAIYLPMIPEALVAMLACARIGAPHTVVFRGFSAKALSSRVLDCGPS